ncbi:MAG: hypothetical protein AOA65_2304 [Candidatus Bathyarchaeota archaeon BA1]|nr:MAG: hypothetical protein AOA65_2304 [Candidatus Bathyarchaeota archaeon BA1]
MVRKYVTRRRTIKRCGYGAYGTFKSTMLFLKSEGCIKSGGPKHNDLYAIMKRGKKGSRTVSLQLGKR